MAKDLYEILNIKKDATEGEIKKAYRKLALDWHPDKHKGDKKAEEKFKEINQAYEILSDKQKRDNYDRFGHAANNFTGGQAHNGFSGSGFDFSGFSANFSGADGFSDIFEAFFNGFGSRSNTPRKGRTIEFEMKINFEEAAFGCEKELQISRPDQNTGKSKIDIVKVKIPAGVEMGSIVRVSGKGENGYNGGPPGDLYVHIIIAPHSEFTRKGPDVHSQKNISVLQAILGDEININTIEGEVKMKIPAGTQPGKVFKLKGHGVKKIHSNDKGDHYVKINVAIPTKLNRKEKNMYQELAKESGMNIKSKGIFG